MTVHDATDEVVACTSASGLGDGVWSEDFRGLAVLQNPGGDQQLLEVVVVASPCDRRADVTFWRGRFGHELLVYLPDEFSGCRGEAVYQRVMLELSEKVPVFDTSVSVRSVNWPEAGPTPQVPELPSGMRCHYADLPEMTPSVGITDTVGLINECTSFIGDRPAPDRFGVSVRNPAGNPDVLEVYWAIDSWCTDMPARLELSRSGDGYTLSVNQLTSSSACHSGASVQGVTLSLDAPLAAVDVLPELTITSATDLAATAPDEHFTLALTAGRDFYSAGERVDVLASLTYLGMDSPVDVYAFGSLIAFGVEQLDGGLQMLPVQRTIRTCTTYELLYSEPHLQPYIQSGVWMPDHAYMDDLQAGPELRLPPGLFRIYAFSGFSQDVCGEDGVEMEASVIVRVR